MPMKIPGREITTAAKPMVLVHGAYAGGWQLRPLHELLAAEGRQVYRLTLTGQGEREHHNSPAINLDTHILDVVNVLKYEELTDVILVGHSYGGMVITGVAHRVPERIGHLVYLDAALPEDGETMLSTWPEEDRARLMQHVQEKGEGWKIPPTWPDWGKDRPHPFATFTQPIRLGNPAADKIPGTYVSAVEEGASDPERSIVEERAKARGYNYHEWVIGHSEMVDKPEKAAALLLSIK
ncbi:MAG: alpha/beta fold hydrolase [Candidatus Latescibacteria bacterium]|nr:alpha/beta fold hydrolase [Candidatus Latescibacterota bacterium]